VNAPAIALTTEEAEAIARARAALSWLNAPDFSWPADSGLLKACRDSLKDCLRDYADLIASPPRTHPADLFEELRRGQDNALELALDLVTQDIRDWTRELVRLGNLAEEAARAQAEWRAA
jgi:hypothetical protein